MIVEDRIEKKENDDFQVAEKVMNEILKNNHPKIEKTPSYTSVDLRLTAHTHNKIVKMAVEIKERNSKGFVQIPLTCRKYCLMQNERNEDERLLYFIIFDKNKYLIFDLDKINWNKVKCRMWNIRKTQMDDDSRYEWTPTFFIPITEATYKGEIECLG